jgi:hypothetical protein
MVENRRMAAATTTELDSKDRKKFRGRDLVTFYDRLTDRGPVANPPPSAAWMQQRRRNGSAVHARP